MIRVTRDWVIKQLLFAEFDSYRDVVRKAVWVGFKLSLLAYALNVCAHLLLDWSGLLPYSLSSALVIATVLTPPITFILSGIAYVAVGLAIHDLGVSRAKLERLSRTDMLSGLLNRRAFLEAFDECHREKSLMVIDIDHFKRVNDSCGHLVGDEVIIEVASMITSVFDGESVCARIGGEEFAVFNGSLNFAEFAALGEITRRQIAAKRIRVGNTALGVTVSGGVARALPAQKFGETFSRADKALYAAKTRGRNRIALCYETDQGYDADEDESYAPTSNAA
ncbi:GGDEF domain-containing protein [Hoeflea ulvae]|uniref:diguanylate cyclase n=1 Tax=Hoeflea ulvae TaxID=2983764 RepID=A0ABT3YJL4_9HYPH|nr:GGDEF domain-containing protein [Hoeflea ulvae]MCY0096012.1 GGDEF domain-containing protein [Hoeflea ulvae]